MCSYTMTHHYDSSQNQSTFVQHLSLSLSLHYYVHTLHCMCYCVHTHKLSFSLSHTDTLCQLYKF